jgi:four helix bundle protein
MKSHKDLDVWKKSVELVTEIYLVTKNFPKEELFGIISQLRRASVSIPANIAEGAGRIHEKEFIHFLSISLGSLAELETLILICANLSYISNDCFIKLDSEITSIRKMLIGLTKSIEKK